MRLLLLYLRSRQIGVSTLAAVACAAGLSLPEHSAATALFAVAAVASVAGTALGAPDPAFDRTAARPWHRWRAVHVVALGALAAGLGLLIGPADVVVRNAIGLTGLAALATVALGGGFAWTLPLGWSVVSVVAAMGSEVPAAPLLTWPMQPAGATATVAACVLGAVGLAGYALAGPRLSAGTATLAAAG